jgi:hypothetical protein
VELEDADDEDEEEVEEDEADEGLRGGSGGGGGEVASSLGGGFKGVAIVIVEAISKGADT